MTRKKINSFLFITHNQLEMTECGGGGGNSPYNMDNNYQLLRNKFLKKGALFTWVLKERTDTKEYKKYWRTKNKLKKHKGISCFWVGSLNITQFAVYNYRPFSKSLTGAQKDLGRRGSHWKRKGWEGTGFTLKSMRSNRMASLQKGTNIFRNEYWGQK